MSCCHHMKKVVLQVRATCERSAVPPFTAIIGLLCWDRHYVTAKQWPCNALWTNNKPLSPPARWKKVITLSELVSYNHCSCFSRNSKACVACEFTHPTLRPRFLGVFFFVETNKVCFLWISFPDKQINAPCAPQQRHAVFGLISRVTNPSASSSQLFGPLSGYFHPLRALHGTSEPEPHIKDMLEMAGVCQRSPVLITWPPAGLRVFPVVGLWVHAYSCWKQTFPICVTGCAWRPSDDCARPVWNK